MSAKKNGTTVRIDFVKKFRNQFPRYMIEGPYLKTTKVTLGTLGTLLLVLRSYVLKNSKTESYLVEIGRNNVFKNIDTLMKFKLAGFLYGASVIAWLIRSVGWFPFISYTMLSWQLTTYKFLFGYLAIKYNSTKLKALEEALRYPSLVQNVVTFSIWWSVLAPLIYTKLALKKTATADRFKDLRDFHRWNVSPTLLTVHGINLPFAIIGHLIEPRELKLLDLYNAYLIAGAYLTFYLGVLDRNMIPLYIILSPRSIIGPISYTSIISAYYFIMKKLNEKTPVLQNKVLALIESLN